MGCTYPGTQRKTTGEASKGFPVRKLLCVSVEGGGGHNTVRGSTRLEKRARSIEDCEQKRTASKLFVYSVR